MEISNKLTKAIKEVNYLRVENAARYRVIMRYFSVFGMEQNEQQQTGGNAGSPNIQLSAVVAAFAVWFGWFLMVLLGNVLLGTDFVLFSAFRFQTKKQGPVTVQVFRYVFGRKEVA